MAPPTLLEELHKPIQEAAIVVDEAVKPIIKEVAETLKPVGLEIGTALKVALWGAVGLGLWHLHKSAETGRKRLAS
jgi:hypothetical protein